MLDAIDRRVMLLNAISVAAESKINRPLWAVVRDVCGVGSTTATKICRELHWNPGCEDLMAGIKIKKFSAGDRVDITRWNNYERVKLTPMATVKSVKAAVCESGFMVTIEDDNKTSITIDSNWMTYVE